MVPFMTILRRLEADLDLNDSPWPVRADDSGSATSLTAPPLAGVACLRPSLIEESVQIVALESEAASVTELSSWDYALPRPAADRFFVYAKIFRCLRSS
jgi:hypothetical protein